MPEAPKKTQSKIRTFAQDLNKQREKRGEKPAPVAEEVEPVTKEEVLMAKAPSETFVPKNEPVKVTPPTPKPVTRVVEEKKPEAPRPAPTQIPAFHELQDAVAALQKQPEATTEAKKMPTKVIGKKSSPTANPPRVNIGYDAKVITDTKKKQFHLFPAIAKSLHDWFTALITPRKKSTPTYSVPDASRRKGVIQKATSKTGNAFTTENTDLKEKIRQRQLRAMEEEKARLEAEHEPETAWSPFTNVGYDLIEEPDATPVVAHAPKNVTIEYKKQRTIEVAPPPQENELPDTTQNSAPEETVQEAEMATVSNAPETVTVISTDTPTNVPVEIEETEDTEEQDTEGEAQEIERTGINRYDTNTLAIFFVALIACVALVVLLVQFALSLFEPTEEIFVPTKEESSIPGAQIKHLTLQENQSIINLINQSVSEGNSGLSEAHIYSQNGNLIQPALLIELLQFSMQASFRQALTDVGFVQLNQTKPTIIFTFVDEATVRGGFLNWETTMANDLQSLYSIPEDNSRVFTDETVGDTDVRVLLSETGQTLIVYGFVNENTALISNSLETFSQIEATGFTQ